MDGCDGPRYAQGLCRKHYYRMRRNGSPDVVLRRRDRDPICTVEGCDRPHQARGLCSRHYNEARQRGQLTTPGMMRVCSVDGCDQPQAAKGLCTRHYHAHWNGHGAFERAITKRCPCVMCAAFRAANRAAWDWEQHVYHERARRRRRSAELLPPGKRGAITRALQSGMPPAEAARAGGITVQRLWELVRLLPAWGRQVDAALMEARDPNIRHGTEYAYRKRRCRCPDCREWNRQRRRAERREAAS